MADTAPWHARIFPSDGEVPVGAGVHVGGGKIITCAHVIELALGLADITTRPTGQVRVDFPQSMDRRVHRAQVIDNAWFPKRDEAGDLAVLQIVGEDDGDGAQPARRRCALSAHLLAGQLKYWGIRSANRTAYGHAPA